MREGQGMQTAWDIAASLSCDSQFELAGRIASNVGYRLVAETTIQQAEDGQENAEFVRSLFKLADDDRYSSELIGIAVRNERSRRRGDLNQAVTSC